MHVSLPVAVLCALLWGSVARYQSLTGSPPRPGSVNTFATEAGSPAVATISRTDHTVPPGRVLVIIVLGLATVVVHATGHVLAASRRGILNDEIILAPWGELNTLKTPPTTEAALNMHLSGMLANAFVCAVSAMTLWMAKDFKISELLNPLGSHYLLQGEDHVVALRWVFWLNYVLILVNLLPAYPFDMHRLIHAAMALFAPHIDEAITYNASVIWGRAFSLLLMLSAPFSAQYQQEYLLPAWFMLASLGMIGLFATDVKPLNIPPVPSDLPPDDEMHDPAEREARRQYALHPERDGHGPFAQWLEERREDSRRTRQEQEQSEERRVDEILAILHDKGVDALSLEDRTLLERVSARLRRRRQQL